MSAQLQPRSAADAALPDAALAVEVQRFTSELQAALNQFTTSARLLDLAEREVPDAQHRLQHVLKLTDEAAHKTMDLVEQSGPLIEKTAQSAAILDESELSPVARALVKQMRLDMVTVRTNLSEVLLTQGYQDLSGQIIRSVMKLVQELERALSGLVALAAPDGAGTTRKVDSPMDLAGPQIPGLKQGDAAGAQDDVDALLSGLGM